MNLLNIKKNAITCIQVLLLFNWSTTTAQTECFELAKGVYEYSKKSNQTLIYDPLFSDAIDLAYYVKTDNENYVLCVFKDNPVVYVYCGVPIPNWNNFINSFSAGSGFNKYISNYKCNCTDKTSNSLENNLMYVVLSTLQKRYDANRLRIDLIMEQYNKIIRDINNNPSDYNLEYALKVEDNYQLYYQRLATYDLSKQDRFMIAYKWFSQHLDALAMTSNQNSNLIDKDKFNSLLTPLPLIDDTGKNSSVSSIYSNNQSMNLSRPLLQYYGLGAQMILNEMDLQVSTCYFVSVGITKRLFFSLNAVPSIVNSSINYKVDDWAIGVSNLRIFESGDYIDDLPGLNFQYYHKLSEHWYITPQLSTTISGPSCFSINLSYRFNELFTLGLF